MRSCRRRGWTGCSTSSRRRTWSTATKPDPAPYVLAAEMLGVAPQHCVAIEDSVNGVTSALRAGMHVVQLRATSTAAAAMPGVAMVIASLREFPIAPCRAACLITAACVRGHTFGEARSAIIREISPPRRRATCGSRGTMTVNKADRSIKAVQERNIKALKLRPALGRGTATTVTRLRPGQVGCDVTDGDHHLFVDLATESGGGNAGPDPGVLIRGGLGACLAGGYQLWASQMDIDLQEVVVVIEADYDSNGMYGTDDAAPPGYISLRATVRIASSSPEERVRAMVDYADRHSPLLHDLRAPIPVTRTLEISARA